MSAKVASTGLSYGGRAEIDHAERAVKRALERGGLANARGVILFLTPHYAANPEPAIRAAARAAGCLQVIGATAAGILTEEEWVLDAPGAAAMVLTDPVMLAPAGGDTGDDEALLLSLCTPSGLTADWLDIPARRLGAISGDLFGHGPFKVWSTGRVADSGHTDIHIRGARGVITASQGVRALTSPIEVAEVHGYDIKRLGNYPALNVLVKSLPSGIREMERIPLHLIMGGVTFGDPMTAIRDGRYRLNHIVSANVRDQSITLSHPLNRGERLFWAMRDSLTAERDMRHIIDQAATTLRAAPSFAILFPCMGRGPHFYGNRDRDLEALSTRFPQLPVIGMYGNGEIGPLDGANHLYQYSTVLGLFSAKS
ncbi:MAG: FIST C-terminal domain-containing protein [Gammaproteobacteria bacterium]|nr:FIST C-terminal domain-containing protein [Gammaproteobacteria bacterium]